MPDPLSYLDDMLSFVPPLLRIILWGALSGVMSMAIYARLSPQQKILAIKTQHKKTREKLKTYDGEWDGLCKLIKEDLGQSFSEIRLVFIPFMVCCAPVVLLTIYLIPLYPDNYLSFGPDWMQGFEFCYFSVLIIASLIMKFTFKIV